MQFFIISGILATMIVFIVSFMLRKTFPTRSFDITFGVIVITFCVIGFLGTVFFINGWEGMAYGFLCFFILIGTLIGMFFHQIMKLYSKGVFKG